MPKQNSLSWPKGRKLQTIEFQNISEHPHLSRSALSNFAEDGDEDKAKTFAGFTADNRYSWMAKKSLITITKMNNKNCPIIYNFAKSDQDHCVTCCVGFGDLLLIGTKSDEGKGFVHLFNPMISKLMNTIEIPYAISSIEIISLHGGADKSLNIFFKTLRWFFGIAAVGTEEGHVFLVDLRLDDESLSAPEEEEVHQIEIIPLHAKKVPMLREACFDQNTHLAFELNRRCHDEGLFHFINQENEIIESYYPSDVSVTSICFEPRCSIIFIGYSFGQFQIFSLNKLELLYGCDFENANLPIAKFAFQEPENDPKNFCYLWVIYGLKEDSFALKVNMFQLMFAQKEITATNDSAGLLSRKVFYHNLQLCGLRFEQILCDKLGPNCRCDFIHCQIVEKYHKGNDLNVSMDEDMSVSPESSLCVLTWETFDVSQSRKHSALNMFIFDINRWYLAQMPGGLSNKTTDQIYSSFCSNDSSKMNKILAGNVDGVMQRYFFKMRSPPDEFLRPSALSFTCNMLTETTRIRCKCHGLQTQAIESLVLSNQEHCLLEPEYIFNELHAAGLIVLLKVKGPMSAKAKREYILSACLEQSLVTFLMALMQNTATGKYAAAGCTLRMFHDWMWSTVQNVKEEINALCIPIFDCSSTILDTNILIQFNSYITQILHLRTLFELLYQLSTDQTESNTADLNTKVIVVKLIHDYISAVRWFINNNLLPEQLPYEDEANIFVKDDIFIYNYKDLKSTFVEQRKNLCDYDNSNLLMIDGMIDSIGSELTMKWQHAGGEACYPPPSIMDLLNIYYMDGADILSKNCVVIYFLLDLLDMFESKRELMGEDIVDYDALTRIGHFPQHFSVPLSVVKLIQGFWHLDHKDYDQALDKFLSCDTAAPYLEWQDKRILEAYLSQKCNSHALKYMLHKIADNLMLNDINLQINIYVKNSHVLAAWKLVQQSNQEDVFEYFMRLCESSKLIPTLLSLPLSKKEEDGILLYLSKSSELSSHHQIVLYFFKRGRYVEGIQAFHHTGMSHTITTNLNRNRKHQVNLQKIVRAYSHVLPKVERDRANNKRVLKTLTAAKKEIYKVKPTKPIVLSGAIDSPMTQSTSLSRKQEFKKDEMKNQILFTPFRKKPVPKILEKIVEKPKRRESISSTLLQTPPIQRTKRRFSTKAFPEIAISTPQSILKKKNFNKLVRNIFQKETLPESKAGSDVFLIEDSGIENKDFSPEMSLSQKRLSDWVESTTQNINNKQLNDSSPESSMHEFSKQSSLRDRFNDSIKIATPQTPKVLRFNLASPKSESESSLIQEIGQEEVKDHNDLLETLEVDVTGFTSSDEEKEAPQKEDAVVESGSNDDDVVVLSSDEDVSSKEENDYLEEEDENCHEVIEHNEEENEVQDISSDDEEENKVQDISSDDEIVLNYQIPTDKIGDADKNDSADNDLLVKGEFCVGTEKFTSIEDEQADKKNEEIVVKTQLEEEVLNEEQEKYKEIDKIVEQEFENLEQQDDKYIEIESSDKEISDICFKETDTEVTGNPKKAENEVESVQDQSNDDEGMHYISCTSSSIEEFEVTANLDWLKTTEDAGVVPPTSASEDGSLPQLLKDDLPKLTEISHPPVDPHESIVISSNEESSPIKTSTEQMIPLHAKEQFFMQSDEEINDDVKNILEEKLDEIVAVEENFNNLKSKQFKTIEIAANQESDKQPLLDVMKQVEEEPSSIYEKMNASKKDESVVDSNKSDDSKLNFDVDTKSDLVVKKVDSQVIEKLKSEPHFVLSPPKLKPLKTRSSSRKIEKSRQVQNAEAVEPTFVFTPPTTRKRSMRTAAESELSTALDTSSVSIDLRSKQSTPSRKSKIKPETPTRSSSRLRKKSQHMPTKEVVKPLTPKQSTRRKTAKKKISTEGTQRINAATKGAGEEAILSNTDVAESDNRLTVSIPKFVGSLSTDQEFQSEEIIDRFLPSDELQLVTPPQKQKTIILRRTPSRQAKLKSGYYSSATDTEVIAGVTSESDNKPKRTKTASSTETKTMKRSTRSKKFHPKKSWSPAKEDINLLPVISESESLNNNEVAKKKGKKSINPAPPIYRRRTRSQRKSYAIK